ncbi:CsiV family protein [Kangiella marina]
MFKYFISLALLLTSTAVSAQTIFDVELVFFKRINDLHLVGQPEPIPLSEEFDSESSPFYLSENSPMLPEGYTLLSRQQQQLEGVYRRLRSSSDMRPLLHIGWRQELQDKADTPWLSFNLTDSPQVKGLEGFEGIIRLSRNQGLVLESQVVGYKEPTQVEVFDTVDEETEEVSNLDLPFEKQQDDVESNAEDQEFHENLQIPDELSGFFEMSETLKVKLGKLYYIDHPTMGLLVKVTPYQASLEEQDALN